MGRSDYHTFYAYKHAFNMCLHAEPEKFIVNLAAPGGPRDLKKCAKLIVNATDYHRVTWYTYGDGAPRRHEYNRDQGYVAPYDRETSGDEYSEAFSNINGEPEDV